MAERPRTEFRPIDRRNKASIWLQSYRADVKSQSGEDGVFEKIFELIGTENKFVVDFGAGDGVGLSNSYNLVQNKGWSAVLIEPGPPYEKLEQLYKDNVSVVTINDIVGFDEHNLLDAHLANASIDVPQNPDLVSIDIDGCDVYVWQSIKKFRPRVICIEFAHFAPLDVYMMQPCDAGVNAGTSLLAMAEEGKKLGYELVATTAMNAIFVDAPLFPAFNIDDNSVESMHFLGENQTRIVHSCDGTLYLVGMTNNPWKGFEIDEERIQPLPSNMRKWKFDRRIWPSTKLT